MAKDLIKLGILGANGRSGSKVLSLLDQYMQFQLVAAVCAPQAAEIGRVAREADKNFGQIVHYTSDIGAASALAEIWIDFSSVESSLLLLRKLAERGVACVLATTGFSEPQRAEIRNLATKMPLLLSSNMSRGVFVVGELVKIATKLLGESYDIEIQEIHHRAKKDAPSGTALTLAEHVKSVRPLQIVTDRYSKVQERASEQLGMTSIRGGDVAGEHTVFFLGAGERIEITHIASDRALFARGALEMALLMHNKTFGLYSISDLIQT